MNRSNCSSTLFMDCGVAALAGRYSDYIEACPSPQGQGYVWPRLRERESCAQHQNVST